MQWRTGWGRHAAAAKAQSVLARLRGLGAPRRAARTDAYHEPTYLWSASTAKVREERDWVTVTVPFRPGYRPACQVELFGRCVRIQVMREGTVEEGATLLDYYCRTVVVPCEVLQTAAETSYEGDSLIVRLRKASSFGGSTPIPAD